MCALVPRNGGTGEIIRKEAMARNTFLAMKTDISWWNCPLRNEGFYRDASHNLNVK